MTPKNPAQGPRSARSPRHREKTPAPDGRRGPRCGRGGVLGTPLAEQSLLCAALPASGRIRAPSTSWGDRGRSRPAHVDQLSGRCRPLRKSYAAELSRRSSDTYEFRPADRTDDYSAADFVISEALQQTDFDEIRHGVLSGWTAPLGIEPRSWIRGSIPLPSTTSRIRGVLDVRVRADPRERGPPYDGGHGRLAEAGACRSS